MNNRAVKIIVIFIFTYLTTMLLCINANIDINFKLVYFDTKNLLNQFSQILTNFDIISVIIGVMIYFFYYTVFFNGEKYSKENIFMSIFSAVLATLIVIGKNLELTNAFPNLSNVIILFETTMIFLGAYLAFYSILKKLYSLYIDMFKSKNLEKKKKK